MPIDEYRYLTFLYYDLVDSTPLSQQLDAEHWREFLRAFQSVCMGIIAHHGGETHDHRGDGSLAYFGYPSTHRISAVQAIRAGLELVSEAPSPFGKLNRELIEAGHAPVRVRVGIHSGRVVIGSIGGRQTATGYALAFAERLHRCATPNAVVVSDPTRRLIGKRFALESLGERVLKGIERPALCHRVLAEREDLEVLQTPFVGRARELKWLENEWNAIGPGLPRMVLVAGEAGIGKSRLVSAFGAKLPEAQITHWFWRCLPDVQHNALHPIENALRCHMRTPAVRAFGDPLTMLKMLLPPHLDASRAIPAIATLLGLADDARYADTFPSAEARRELCLDTLVEIVVHTSRTRPLLLVVEDAHWIDRTTCQCLERLSARNDCGPMAVILLQRTDTSESWSSPLTARTLELGRLDTASAHQFAQSVLDGHAFDEVQIERLIEHSDGVPLFIEESVHLEIDRQQRGAGKDAIDSVFSGGSYAPPPRLLDLLNERLDRVDDARETAGLAAAIGREFPLSLLQCVSSVEPGVLQQHVRRLVDSGLVLRQRFDNDVVCRFKHALVRDSAYALLLDSRRRSYHARIAEALEREGWQDAPASPDRLASHYAASGQYDRAIELWIRASQDACRRSEHCEALSHLLNAQRLVDSAPETIESLAPDTLLQLHLTLLRCYLAVEGYASEEAYRQAKLAERQALESDALLPQITARIGRVTWLFTRGQVYDALTLAEDSLYSAETAFEALDSDVDGAVRERLKLVIIRVHWACGNIEFHLGHFKQALRRIDRCIEVFKASRPLIRRMDHEPLVMCLCYRAWYEWESGDPDGAMYTVTDAVSHAYSNGRSFAIALSLSFQAALHLFRGEHEQSLARASESIAISRRSSYATWLAWALVLRGRARCERASERDAGIAEIEEGLRIWTESRALVTRPFMLAQLAEACLLSGQVARARTAIAEAREIVDSTGDRYYEIMITRLEALLAPTESGATGPAQQTLAHLHHALDLAEQRGQHGSALKVVITLCPLVSRSQACSMKSLLEKALGRMTSGADTADQRKARSLTYKLESEHLMTQSRSHPCIRSTDAELVPSFGTLQETDV